VFQLTYPPRIGDELFDPRKIVSWNRLQVKLPRKLSLWLTKPKTACEPGHRKNYDVAPDGNRCVVLMPVESAEPHETQSHVTLVVNFFDEVRRRVAAHK